MNHRKMQLTVRNGDVSFVRFFMVIAFVCLEKGFLCLLGLAKLYEIYSVGFDYDLYGGLYIRQDLSYTSGCRNGVCVSPICLIKVLMFQFSVHRYCCGRASVVY